MAIVDSFSESNQNDYHNPDGGLRGQSFTCTNAATLTSCKFYMYGVSSPSGNVYAKLYSHKGTYGSTSEVDVLLATSDPINANTFNTSGYELVEWTFSGAE